MSDLPSYAAQIIITLIPIVGIVMGGIVVLLFLLWNHKQRMKLIEQGVTPPSFIDVDTFSLFAGLLSLGVGLVLTLFFIIVPDGPHSLLGGLIPLAVGLSLLAFYNIRRGTRKE